MAEYTNMSQQCSLTINQVIVQSCSEPAIVPQPQPLVQEDAQAEIESSEGYSMRVTALAASFIAAVFMTGFCFGLYWAWRRARMARMEEENSAGTELRAGVAVAEGAGAAVRGRDSGYYSLEGGVEVAEVADDAGVDTDADADENTPAEDSGEMAGGHEEVSSGGGSTTGIVSAGREALGSA